MSIRDPKGTSCDPGLYRSHSLIIPPCVDYDTNRVFGHRAGAYAASSWEL